MPVILILHEKGYATDMINVAEALQEKKIAQIADTIFHKGENGQQSAPGSDCRAFLFRENHF